MYATARRPHIRYSQEAAHVLQPGGHMCATARRLHIRYSQEATHVLQPTSHGIYMLAGIGCSRWAITVS